MIGMWNEDICEQELWTRQTDGIVDLIRERPLLLYLTRWNIKFTFQWWQSWFINK